MPERRAQREHHVRRRVALALVGCGVTAGVFALPLDFRDRIAIRELLNQGRTRAQIIDYFIKKYGGQVALAAPLDRGFNRLAWLLPYSLAAVAAGGLGYGAYRMAKRPKAPESNADPSVSDQELADKLDDELRNLD